MSESNGENLDKSNEDSIESEESSLVKSPEIDEKIEEILEAIPAPEKKQQARHTIQEFFALIERSSSGQINPDVARILAESADKDNDNKFRYLTQKQTDEASAQKREDEFKVLKHNDRFKLVKPIIFFVLLLVAGCVVTGIWLCIIGKEVLGASLLTGIFSAVFGYLAGIGTSDFFKDK